MKKPDNQRTDLEAMRRQLRQEFRGVAIELIEEKLNELILIEDGFGSPSGVPDDPEGDDDKDEDEDDEKGVPPFVDVKFRNIIRYLLDLQNLTPLEKYYSPQMVLLMLMLWEEYLMIRQE